MTRFVFSLSVLVILVAIFAIFCAPSAFAQERTQVQVKKTVVVSGVVVIDIVKDSKTMELQCNEGQTACKTLNAGGYWMIELPKNWGMYDCRNAEIYPGDKEPEENPDPNARVGAYCLIEK